MAIPDATRSDGALIANQYQVDPNKKLPPAGGLAAFGAIDRLAGRTDLMAIQLSRRWPPRSRALQALAAPIEGLLTPLAYGPAGTSATQFVRRRRGQVCRADRAPGLKWSCWNACFAPLPTH